jgi:hypothetical protein
MKKRVMAVVFVLSVVLGSLSVIAADKKSFKQHIQDELAKIEETRQKAIEEVARSNGTPSVVTENSVGTEENMEINKTNPEWLQMFVAASEGDHETVKRLLLAKKEDKEDFVFDTVDKKGNTLFHVAKTRLVVWTILTSLEIETGDHWRKLFQTIRKENNQRQTPYIVHADKGNWEIIRQLMWYGTNPHLEEDTTFLHALKADFEYNPVVIYFLTKDQVYSFSYKKKLEKFIAEGKISQEIFKRYYDYFKQKTYQGHPKKSTVLEFLRIDNENKEAQAGETYAGEILKIYILENDFTQNMLGEWFDKGVIDAFTLNKYSDFILDYQWYLQRYPWNWWYI